MVHSQFFNLRRLITFVIIKFAVSQKKIVVTGGPSTGKTSVIRKLGEMGFFCMEEIIRTMTSERKNEVSFKSNPIVSVADPLAFNQRILKGRIDQYKTAHGQNAETIFFDRGIPDVLAYMDCFGQDFDADFENMCKAYRYDVVFLMPPWREIHIKDEQRFETYEESLRVNDCLKGTYETYGYKVIEVPKLSVGQRVQFILQNLAN